MFDAHREMCQNFGTAAAFVFYFYCGFTEATTTYCLQDELSGADIKALCTESGLLALRERRMRVTHADFKKARDKVLYKKKEGVPEGLYM